jgi:phospholipid-binding lipoprotein MlaA
VVKQLTARMATLVMCIAATAMLGGCATSGNPKDPIEGFNRAMFTFNEGVDKGLIKPAAQGYEAAVPMPLRTGVSNFFANIADVFISVNNLLQGKPREAASDIGRVVVNSTIGILGLFDVASDLGMEKHDEDFGQTFGRWGVGDGPYVVLPLLGPHTSRDVVGEFLDLKTDPVAKVDNIPSRNVALVTRVISVRAAQLPADKLIEEAALDKYSYIRDAYLQRRRFKIYDGNPPRQDDSYLEVESKTVSLDHPEAAPVAAEQKGEASGAGVVTSVSAENAPVVAGPRELTLVHIPSVQ